VPARPARLKISPMFDGVVVQTVGEIVDGAREYARRQVTDVVQRLQSRLPARSQVRSARVKLTVATRSSGRCPVLAQANLDIGEALIRAQVAAAFVHEASLSLRARLAEQVSRLTNPDQPRPWPTARRAPEPVAVPAGTRGIVRHKTYPLARTTPDRAALTMDVMDYDCHLFVDADSEQDSLIYRVGPTGYRLSRMRPLPPPPASVTPLTIDPYPTPELTAEEAVARLDATEMPYRFFRDRNSGRGTVLYRRHDGHYGLITPATGGR
jgi:sigma 54 modulation/S30EA-like ribosomal protein